MTKYTFLLPAYKGRYLDEMLQSIQSQTYIDFKVIVSDDCSPEDLYGICKPYLEDPRFSYRRNDKNIGGENLVAHWNLLVDMCESDYLIMASDDDVYEPQFLEEIDTLTVKYPEVNLFRARAKMIDGNGEILSKDIMLDECLTQLEFLYYLYYIGIQKCVAHYVFRTHNLKIKGGFFNLPLAWGCDDLTAVINSENSVCNTSSICFSFRLSGMNISSSGDLQVYCEKTKEIYTCLEFLEQYLPQVRKKVKTKREEWMYKSVESSLNQGYYIKNLCQGAEYASFSEVKKYYKYLSQKGVLNGKLAKLHFIWTWLRAFNKRKNEHFIFKRR